VEHLTQLAIRRIHRKDVSRGMSAWIDMWHDVTHTRAMLARVSARLVRPKMVLAYAHWRLEWDMANAEQSKQSVQQRLASELRRRETAEAALGNVREEMEMEKRELVVAVEEARTAALDYLRQLREARREAIDNSELAVTWQAKAEEMTDEERVGRRAQELLAQQQAREEEATEARLARLLAEQRAQLHMEAAEMRDALERKLASLRQELDEARAIGKRKPGPSDSDTRGKDAFSRNMQARADDFFTADADGSHELGLDEFSAMVHLAYKREGKPIPNAAGMEALFKELDLDCSGSVDLSEYVQWALREALQTSRGRILDLFKSMDTDSSGYIDRSEFGTALQSMGFKCGKSDVNKIYSDLDPDGSGMLEYSELNASLRRSLSKKQGAAGAGGGGGAVGPAPAAPKTAGKRSNKPSSTK